MIDPNILPLLCCPETRQPLRLADQSVLDRVNQAIAGGATKDHAGRPVTQILEAALIREDGKLLYPIRNQIPLLIAEQGIAVV